MVRKLHNFDDWIDYFRYWQDSIGLEQDYLRSFQFEAKFGEPEVPHIEFGHYRGQRKWPTVMHIPDQRIRDALLNLIVYQGDTEFASVEQQRNLLQHAPSDYDLLSLQRVMTEEMRHGWQMSYLLCTHFGDEGKRGSTSSPTRSSSIATASSSSRCCRSPGSTRCHAPWGRCSRRNPSTSAPATTACCGS